MRKTIWIPDNDQQVNVLQALKRIEKRNEGVTTRKPTLAEIGRECDPPLSIATVHRVRKTLRSQKVILGGNKHRQTRSNYEFPKQNRRRA